MKNTAAIRARLIDLLEILDARAMVNIFVDSEDKSEKKSYSICFLKVYEFLAEPELMHKYKNFDVIGIQVGLTTNILIKEA